MLKIKTQTFLWLLFSLLALQATAQSTITSTQYFQNQLQKLTTFEKENGISAASTTSFKPSWLRDIDIRTETRDFDWERQQYLVRLSPSTRKIRAAQNQLHASIAAKFSQDDKSYYQDLIERLYEQWLDLYEINLQLKANKSLLLVYEDIETVLTRMAEYSTVKAKDILDSQRELLETQENIQRMEWIIGNEIEEGVPTFADMIPIDQVKLWMDNLSVISSENSIENTKSSVRKNILAAEIELEEAEAQNIFDFFQIEYNGPHDDGLNERISIGAGLKIPFSSDRTIKLEELKLEKDLLDKKEVVAQYLQQELLEQKKKEFLIAVQELNIHHELYTVQEKKTNLLVEQLMQTKKVDPLLPLYQQVDFWEQRLEVIKMELKIYKIYLSYLKISGNLYNIPFTNYLTQINK